MGRLPESCGNGQVLFQFRVDIRIEGTRTMSTSTANIDRRSRASGRTRAWKKRLALGLTSLVFVGSSVVAAGAPASAAIVPNVYDCNPATGWCYQTNPPHQPSPPRACR